MIIEMNKEERKVYDVAKRIREYGERTNQPTYGFADSFYNVGSRTNKNGKQVHVIKFKEHMCKSELGEVPDDIESKEGDKLYIAFTIGLVGGKPHWVTPDKKDINTSDPDLPF